MAHLLILRFLGFLNLNAFYHRHVISNFQTFCHKKILHFLQPVKPKVIGIGNFKAGFLKLHFHRNCMRSYTQMVISQKVGGVWTWFWYQIKAESVLLTVVPISHFPQNVTCSLFCGSALQMFSALIPIIVEPRKERIVNILLWQFFSFDVTNYYCSNFFMQKPKRMCNILFDIGNKVLKLEFWIMNLEYKLMQKMQYTQKEIACQLSRQTKQFKRM